MNELELARSLRDEHTIVVECLVTEHTIEVEAGGTELHFFEQPYFEDEFE